MQVPPRHLQALTQFRSIVVVDSRLWVESVDGHLWAGLAGDEDEDVGRGDCAREPLDVEVVDGLGAAGVRLPCK